MEKVGSSKFLGLHGSEDLTSSNLRWFEGVTHLVKKVQQKPFYLRWLKKPSCTILPTRCVPINQKIVQTGITKINLLKGKATKELTFFGGVFLLKKNVFTQGGGQGNWHDLHDVKTLTSCKSCQFPCSNSNTHTQEQRIQRFRMINCTMLWSRPRFIQRGQDTWTCSLLLHEIWRDVWRKKSDSIAVLRKTQRKTT